MKVYVLNILSGFEHGGFSNCESNVLVFATEEMAKSVKDKISKLSGSTTDEELQTLIDDIKSETKIDISTSEDMLNSLIEDLTFTGMKVSMDIEEHNILGVLDF